MTLKNEIANLVEQTLNSLPELAESSEIPSIGTTVERTRDPRHGDFTTNVAMRLAKSVGRNPREIAQSIVDAVAENELVRKIEIAGPGFINFHLSRAAFHAELTTVLERAGDYGRQERRPEPKVLLEFVSANPTGPLHVGHGRHASYGATLGNLLDAAGFSVDREYYVNDSGRQMDILAVSVILRALEAAGETNPFPEGGYKGEYIREISTSIDSADLDGVSGSVLFSGLPDDGPDGDKEAVISGLVRNAEDALGTETFHKIRRQSLESILDDIKDDLG